MASAGTLGLLSVARMSVSVSGSRATTARPPPGVTFSVSATTSKVAGRRYRRALTCATNGLSILGRLGILCNGYCTCWVHRYFLYLMMSLVNSISILLGSAPSSGGVDGASVCGLLADAPAPSPASSLSRACFFSALPAALCLINALLRCSCLCQHV